MAYIERNALGEITSLYANPQLGRADEFLPDDSPELVDFLKPAESQSEEEIIDYLSGTPVISDLIADVADLKGETRQDTIARMKGRR